MNGHLRFPAKGIVLSVDVAAVQKQIMDLNAQSAQLDWTIPSEWEQIMDNANLIDDLTMFLHVYQTSSPFPPKGEVSAALTKAAGRTPTPPPPFSKSTPPSVASVTGIRRKKHLSLVWVNPNPVGKKVS
jgi:hypothetical protein